MSLPTSFRRSWMILALSAFVLSPAQAQRVIHMVVPFGPGAVQDVIARTFNAELGRLTLVSYPAIALPSMVMMVALMFWLARGARQLTGLELGQMMHGQG